MKKLLLTLILPLCFLLLAGGCNNDGDDAIRAEGVIAYYPPPDSCNDYMIVIDGNLFKPNELTNEFMVDNLPVMLTYTLTSEKHNCGFGGYHPIINIIKINKK